MPRPPKPPQVQMTLRVPQPIMEEFDALVNGRNRTECIIDAMTAWMFVQKGMGAEVVPRKSRLRAVPDADDSLDRLMGAEVELYCDHVPVNHVCVECGEAV